LAKAPSRSILCIARWRKYSAGEEEIRGQLIQKRFPVGRHSSGGSRCGLTCGMGVRRKQFDPWNHRLLLVIVEPVLTRLEAGDDRMPRGCRMAGCMLAGRTVAASDVSALRAATEMKPPTVRRREAFYASVARWFRSGIDSAGIFHHFDFSFGRGMPSREFKPPARSSRCRAFLPLLVPRSKDRSGATEFALGPVRWGGFRIEPELHSDGENGAAQCSGGGVLRCDGCIAREPG
jgi:hypothetical protein